MAIATQEVFLHTTAIVETWDVGAATPARTLVKQASSGRYGITKTDTVGVVKPDVALYGDVKVSGVTRPGFSNDQADAIGEFAVGVALDGTWEFAGVTGASASTAQGTKVYATAAGVVTLTEGSNDQIGTVNYHGSYDRKATHTPVKIGA